MDIDRVIRSVMHAGEIMLVCGAEASRVEDTMRRLLLNFDFKDAYVFAVPMMIILTAECVDGQSRTVIKRVTQGRYHMGKISMVNELSRELDRGQMSIEDFDKRLDKIDAEPSYSVKLRVLAASLGVFSIAFGISYDLISSLAALVIGGITYFVTNIMKDRNVAGVMVNVYAGLMVSLVTALTVAHSGLSLTYEVIVFGAIIPYVPGIAITSAMRDIMEGDIVSGTIRAVDAFTVAISLALGVYFGGFLMGVQM